MRLSSAAIDHGGDATSVAYGRNKVVPVKILTAQGDEEFAGRTL